MKGMDLSQQEALFNQVKEKLMQDWYNFYFE